MKLNKKVLLFTMLVICVAWVYNLIVFKVSQIDKPLFFRQETYVNEDGILEIMGLQKPNLNNWIVSIQFPEISDKEIMISGSSSSETNNVKFEKMIIFLGNQETYDALNLKNNLKNGNVVISKMKYTTSDGKVEEVNIGKITIGKKFEYKEEYKILQHLGTTSNEKDGNITYKTKDNLEIVDIEGESLENINKYYDVYINNEKLDELTLPIKVEKNKAIEIYYEMKKGLKEKDLEFEQYNMQLKLKCSDPEGTIDYITADFKIDLSTNDNVTKASLVSKLKKRLEGN